MHSFCFAEIKNTGGYYCIIKQNWPEGKAASVVDGQADLLRAEAHRGACPLLCVQASRVEGTGGPWLCLAIVRVVLLPAVAAIVEGT